MPLPIQPVTCIAKDAQDNPLAGALYLFELVRLNDAGQAVRYTDIFEGLVASGVIEGTADENGELVVNLFANEEGLAGTQYRVTATNPNDGTKFLNRRLLTVPNQPCNLHEILDADPPPPVSDAQAAINTARAWANKMDGPVGDGEYSAKHYAASAAAGVDSILATYAAVRAYSGLAKNIYVSGYLVTAAPAKIAGQFTVDDSDITSADNGGTILVAANGKRWKRVFEGNVQASWFGVTYDGVTDDLPAMQSACDYTRNARKRVLECDDGVCLFNGTLKLHANAGLRALKIVGGNGSFIGTTQFKHHASQLTQPLISVHASRSLHLVNIRLTGNNVAPQTQTGENWINTNPASWVSAGCSELRYAPYAGIVIDGLTGASPGAGQAYTFDAYGQGTSSKLTFERCRIEFFVVGAAIQPSQAGTGSEDIVFRDCSFIENKYHITTSQTQSRAVSAVNCNFNGAFCQFDGVTFGLQTGCPIEIYGGIHGKAVRLLQSAADGGVLQWFGGYCENVASIGIIGKSATSGNHGAGFFGVNFSMIGLDNNGTVTNKDIILKANVPVMFDDCDFVAQFHFNVIPNKTITFHSCHWRAMGSAADTTPGEQENFGVYTPQGSEHKIIITGGSEQRSYAGPTKLLDDEPKVAIMPARAIVMPNTRKLHVQTARGEYKLNPMAEVRTANVSTFTYVNADTATFIETTASAKIVRPGDLLYSRINVPVVPGQAAETTIAVALRVVTRDAGTNLCTCKILADVDTTYVPASVDIRVPLFVTATAITGTATNGSPNITAATNVANVRLYDWLTHDDGTLVQHLRVDGVDVGAGTITVHRNMNASRPGVTFYNTKATNLADRFDGAELADYTALRAFTGAAKTVWVHGFQPAAAPNGGIAGFFTRDDSDSTSADNGGTVIVTTAGKRWKRVDAGNGQILDSWFGVTGTGDQTINFSAFLSFCVESGLQAALTLPAYTVSGNVLASTSRAGTRTLSIHARVPTVITTDAAAVGFDYFMYLNTTAENNVFFTGSAVTFNGNNKCGTFLRCDHNGADDTGVVDIQAKVIIKMIKNTALDANSNGGMLFLGPYKRGVVREPEIDGVDRTNVAGDCYGIAFSQFAGVVDIYSPRVSRVLCTPGTTDADGIKLFGKPVGGVGANKRMGVARVHGGVFTDCQGRNVKFQCSEAYLLDSPVSIRQNVVSIVQSVDWDFQCGNGVLEDPQYIYKKNGATSPLGASHSPVVFQQLVENEEMSSLATGGKMVTEVPMIRYCSLTHSAGAKASVTRVTGLRVIPHNGFATTVFTTAILESRADTVEAKSDETTIEVSDCKGPITAYCIAFNSYGGTSLTSKLNVLARDNVSTLNAGSVRPIYTSSGTVIRAYKSFNIGNNTGWRSIYGDLDFTVNQLPVGCCVSVDLATCVITGGPGWAASGIATFTCVDQNFGATGKGVWAIKGSATAANTMYWTQDGGTNWGQIK